MKKTKSAVPTLSDVSALYTELLAKRTTLQQEHGEVLANISKAHTQILARNSGSANTNRQDRRVAVILGDEPNGEADFDRVKLKELEDRGRDLQKAIEVIDGRLSKERGVVSRKICEEIRPLYSAKVRAMAVAMIGLYETIKDYDSLKDELIARDLAWNGPLPVMGANAIKSKIESWLNEAKREGFVEADILPKGVIESEIGRPSYA